MKRIDCVLAALIMVLASSCSRMEEEVIVNEPIQGSIITLRATQGDNPNTKTVRQDDGSIWWSKDDAINVFYGDAQGKFTTDISESAATASFSGTLEGEAGNSAVYWGVYPYNEDNTFDGTGVTMTVPSEQKGVPGTFADKLNPSVARSETESLSFYNVGSWFVFTVAGEGITSATFSGNNGEDIAGKIKVTMDSNGKPVAEVIEGVKAITITPEDGGSFVPDKEYRIVLLPQTMTKGYTITLYKDNKASECVVSKSAAFERSMFRGKHTVDNGSWHGDYVAMGENQLWARTNIGASSPEKSGYYFAWGETETKAAYYWSNYKWGSSRNALTKYNDDPSYGAVDNPIYMYLQADDDAARGNLGPGWLTPQKEDWQWLIDNCTWTWVDDYQGTNMAGYVVTSKVEGYTSNSIFLPASGLFGTRGASYVGEVGYYWSANPGLSRIVSPQNRLEPYYAWDMLFNSSEYKFGYQERFVGLPVRPIYKAVDATSIYLTPASLTLNYGEEATLTAIVLPANATDQTITWESSDETVVKVSQDGTVTTSDRGGTATIIASCAGGAVTASCEVTVIIPVTGVELAQEEITICLEDSFQLEASVSPSNATNQIITFLSSDESVATVDQNGLIVAKKLGSVSITVQSEDGGFTGTCEVTVTDEINGHKFVLMGVTSADGKVIKWATMNVGATSPEEYGDYFAWGETEPKEEYSWATYKWMTPGMASASGINKYQVAGDPEYNPEEMNGVWYNDSGEFIGDGLTELERADDAASVNWGSTWRTPTRDEWEQLADKDKFYCEWDSTRKGYIVTSQIPGYEGNQIFLPATYERMYEYPYYEYDNQIGKWGYYWSSSHIINNLDTEWCIKLSFYGNSDFISISSDRRFVGLTVRPVSE